MSGEIFHVMNRGVDKRQIFYDDHERARFLHNMFEFNDTKPAQEYDRRHVGPTRSHIREREKLVDIHGWCLMGNHYHLLLSERMEGGVTLFLMKLNVGYAKFFNEKYERSGTLFQGRTKKVLIDHDAHFLYILHYIHLNPLDLLKETANWRTQELKSVSGALRHLEEYKWSSFKDYCGIKNFPSVLSKDLFGDIFKNYRQAMRSYLKDIADLDATLMLEN